MDIIQRAFKAAAECKNQLLSDEGKIAAWQHEIETLKAAVEKGATVFVFGDVASRFSVEHQAEELQVRFRSGKNFGRADRSAIPCQHFADLSGTRTATVLRSRFAEGLSGGAAGAFVRFKASPGEDDLTTLVSDLRKHGHVVVDFSVAVGKSGNTPNRAIDQGAAYAAQRVLLHALCEAFEPELPLATVVSESLKLARALDEQCLKDAQFLAAVGAAGETVRKRLHAGGVLYAAGNGGSACDAMELVRAFADAQLVNGKPMQAHHCLSPGQVTCAINDGFPLYKTGVASMGQAPNVLLLYTTSGKSQNIVEAAEFARSRGIFVIGLTGSGGGDFARHCDTAILVPSTRTERIQEIHAIVGFALLEYAAT